MRELTFYDREDRPWPNPRLSRAAIVGHTTENSTRLWIRVRNEGDHWLILSETPVPTDGAPEVKDAGNGLELHVTRNDGTEVPVAGVLEKHAFANADDRTHVFDLEGLNPGTRYHYAVFPDASSRRDDLWELGKDAPHSFRTRKTAPEGTTFGLYSCHMPYDKLNLVNMEMWEIFGNTLANNGADFVIGGGDQVYSDGNPKVSIWNWLKKNKDAMTALPQDQRREVMVSWYRDIYRGYWGPLALRKVFRHFPTYMIWDDHEIMDGWGSYDDAELSDQLDSIWEWENQGENLALAKDMFWAAKKVYGEYQHAHNPPTGAEQWHYPFEWGPCAFFVLDMRGHRDFNRDTDKILGADQLARFKEWMESDVVRNAEVLFIVSPVPVVHACQFIVNFLDLNILGLADDLRDEWEHESNWEERDKILDSVFEFSHATGKRVAFLSGDVHIGAAFRLSRKNRAKARVYQLTSSAITYHLSDLKRNALELIVRKNGDLGHHPHVTKESRTAFALLHILKRNNFGIIRAWPDQDANLQVTWDLYANTGEDHQTLKMDSVKL